MDNSIKINKFLPVTLLYFFFNSFLLPLGLLYTSILTPLFLIWLYQQNRLSHFWVFFLFTIPFLCIHLIHGVEIYYYLKSYALLFTCFVFVLTCNQYLKACHTLREIFRRLLVLNFILVIIACIAFFIPATRQLFWMTSVISSGLENFPRLRLLTYEPSYYSTLLVPLAFYYYLKILLFKLPNANLILLLVTLPLVLSFSLGVLLGLGISFFILFFSNIRTFFRNQRVAQYALLLIALIILALLSLYIFYPDNPLFLRIQNITQGKDTSFKGRSFDSFHLAWMLAKEKSIFFGIGLGQVKLLGIDLWNAFYNTILDPNSVNIPNAVAETLAIFGITGLVLRFLIEIILFFRTRVYSNYFRLGLFIYIFIYQFTGSFIVNVAEYAIWVLAFSNVFEEFNKKNITSKHFA